MTQYDKFLSRYIVQKTIWNSLSEEYWLKGNRNIKSYLLLVTCRDMLTRVVSYTLGVVIVNKQWFCDLRNVSVSFFSLFSLSHVRCFPAEHSGHHRDSCHSGLVSTSCTVWQLPHHLHQPGTQQLHSYAVVCLLTLWFWMKSFISVHGVTDIGSNVSFTPQCVQWVSIPLLHVKVCSHLQRHLNRFMWFVITDSSHYVKHDVTLTKESPYTKTSNGSFSSKKCEIYRIFY